MNFKKRVNGSWVDAPHYIHKTSTDTIATLPADVYADGTNATVGVVGNMSQSGTPTPQNPVMPNGCGNMTGNLINIDDISETVTVIYKDKFLMQSIAEGTYTLSFNTTADVSHMVSVGVGATGYSKDIKTISGVQNGHYTIDFTISAEDSGKNLYVRFVRFGALTTVTYTVTNIMLNTGSTALPYEPYGIKIPISSANTTTPVYLGEVQTTRRIKKLVLTGEESYTANGKNDTREILQAYYTLPSSGTTEATNIICSHLETLESGASTFIYEGIAMRANGTDMIFGFSFANIDVSVSDSATVAMTKLKAYLAQQYAAGTPVTVWYVLAEPTTGIVNEPLRKIGTYADEVSGITIPTIAGANTVDVDTTLQPSEVSVNYHGWHPVQSVHERENGAWD